VGKNPNAAVCVNSCRRLLSFLTNQQQRAVMVDLEHWSSPSRKLEEGRTPDHSEPLRPRGAGSPRWATPPRPLALGPLCTTRSAPKKPIGESRQSEKVRAGTPRLKKARGEVVPLLASCVPRTPVDGRGADRQQAHQRLQTLAPDPIGGFPDHDQRLAYRLVIDRPGRGTGRTGYGARRAGPFSRRVRRRDRVSTASTWHGFWAGGQRGPSNWPAPAMPTRLITAPAAEHRRSTFPSRPRF
jgi:hypothetical protein